LCDIKLSIFFVKYNFVKKSIKLFCYFSIFYVRKIKRSINNNIKSERESFQRDLYFVVFQLIFDSVNLLNNLCSLRVQDLLYSLNLSIKASICNNIVIQVVSFINRYQTRSTRNILILKFDIDIFNLLKHIYKITQ